MKGFGLIHIYTGDGKGKTTAAIGLATRAAGGGFRVLYTSFHKRPEKFGYTEMDSLRQLGVEVINFAKGHPGLDRSLDPEKIRQEAHEAIPYLEERLRQEAPDLLIMDEILIAVRDGFLPEERLIEFIEKKPEKTELVLTGRGATEKVMALADYVSEVKKLKHPFDRRIGSRKGIEY